MGATNFHGIQVGCWKVKCRSMTYKGNNRYARWVCQCVNCGHIVDMASYSISRGVKQGNIRGCFKCRQVREERRMHPERIAYKKYYPDFVFNSDTVIYHLDGDKTNNSKDNLYATTNNKIYHADTKIGFTNPKTKRFVRMGVMSGVHPELKDLRKTLLMLSDLNQMINNSLKIIGEY